MKTYQWLLLQALIVQVLSRSSLEPSFLGVSAPENVKSLTQAVKDPGIIKTPRGLPLEGEDDHALADPKHEGRTVTQAPKEEHHAEPPPRDELAHHGEVVHHDKEVEGHQVEHSEHHGQEGAHGEHHGEEHDPNHGESLSLAYLLMGGVGALMIVFHFACSKDSGIKAATWRVLNMTVSIFVAVLLYGTLKGWIVRTFEPSGQTLVAITLTLFVILFVLTHAVLFRLKGGDKTRLQAFGTIAAHICGFAAMYGFADSQEIEYIEEGGERGILFWITLNAVMIGVLSMVMSQVMNRVALDDGVVDEDEEKWMDTCEECDDDVFCLAVSFLITLFARYLIRGDPQPYEPGHVGNVKQVHANWLLACAVGAAVCIFIGAVCMKKFASSVPHGSSRMRILINIQHLISMIMAWSFLFWSEWQLYVWGWQSSVIGGCLVIAIGMTLVSFVCVILLNWMSKRVTENKMVRRAMSSLEMALGVLVGFSWERAFDVGFEEIEVEYHHTARGPFIVTGMALMLFVAVAPAWRLHILPKAIQFEEEAKNEREATKPQALRR